MTPEPADILADDPAARWRATPLGTRRDPFTGYREREEHRFVAPGEADRPGRRMTAPPVHALVTAYDAHALRGIAWSDGTPIARADVSVDDGRWQPAELEPGTGRWGLTRWHVPWSPGPGTHDVAVRATDAAGRTQPERPAPNLGGFADHAVHRVTLRVD
ncbi:molybdopterin-binding protein [Capillimicrobium parvum]|uniref:hypothetical protein n=1 Tax=Capillimicrobium parvum TaxID=2884022 RepID=UPI00216AB7AB|nr:hypothetical protein [Capillimicrobium parvum]